MAMTIEEEARLSCYQTIHVLDETHQVYLVQHAETRQLFVKKILTQYDVEVFRLLKANHIPSTPYIFELFLEGDTLILIEEYINGRPLSEILQEKGSLSEDEAVSLVRRVCVPLQHMHACMPPIIHRDIKPSNIMINAAGDPILLDMDAAKRVKEEPEDTKLIGTVGYAAPEQYGFGASDQRTDVYALGVLLNVCLTGHLPKEQLAEGRLGQVIQKATQMDPSDRYATVQSFLISLLGQEPTKAVWKIDYNKLPGLRSEAPVQRITAIFAYISLFLLCFSIKIEGASVGVIWLNRVVCFLFFFSMILLSGNYRNVLERLGVKKIRSKWLQMLLIIVLDLVLGFLWIMFLNMLEKWIG